MRIENSKVVGTVILSLIAIIGYLTIFGIEGFSKRVDTVETTQAKVVGRVLVLETKFDNIEKLLEEIKEKVSEK